MQDLHHASASVQGRRPYNEDRSHSLHPLLSPNSPSDPSPPSFFAVFDGHGGEAAVEYVTSHLSSVLTSLPSYASLSSRPQALEEAFLACDAALRSPTAPSIGQSGTTCGCVLIDSDRIVSANCGDTRTVLVTSDSPHPIDLTVDHKPTDDSERRRIEAAGGKVTVNEIPIARNGKKTTITQAYVELGEAGLAVSRAFGDLSFKADGGRGVDEQVVVVRPHVQVRERSVGDEFLVLASDGLWNFVPVDAIVDFVRGRLAADDGERDVEDIACKLVQLALDRKSNDNVTCTLVVFREGCRVGREIRAGRRRRRTRRRRGEENRRGGWVGRRISGFLLNN